MFLKENKTSEALAVFKKISDQKLSPYEQREVFSELGFAELFSGNTDNAEAYFLKSGSSANDVSVALASIYIMKGYTAYAEKALELIKNINTESHISYIISEHNLHIPVHRVASLKAVCYYLTKNTEKMKSELSFLKNLQYDFRSYSILKELEN